MTELEKIILRAYADCNMSIQMAGEKLHYHRNTVRYHLYQVQRKTGLNPRRFWDLVQLMEEVGDG